eukprot:Skav220757  [mRNA]  locus=scaffold2521:35144:37480:+ [translate_table: standard]
MGEGFKAAGAKTVAYVESNDQFVRWLRKHKSVPVIHDDVANLSTVEQVHSITGGSTIVTAGVACQPFSKLGDRREHEDPRSGSFGGTLQLAFLTRAPLIILECAQEVLQSKWAQDMLHAFANQEGCRLTQQVLHLHTIWPSLRTRWWAILSHPNFEITSIPAMPVLSFQPALLNIQSSLPVFTDDEIKQLMLDNYELRVFNSQPGGVSRYVIDYMKPAPTATHSWGTQLSPCHCLCRSSGFNPSRLESKGLYGVILPMGYCTEVGQHIFHQMRFPHPREAALWNGLQPEYVSGREGFTLKLELAGVGQLASPLQAGWVLSQAYSQASLNGFDMIQTTPELTMLALIDEVIQSRDNLWHVTPTPYTEAFVRELRILLDPAAFPREPPAQIEEDTEQHEPAVGLAQLISAECDRVDPASVSRSRSPPRDRRHGYRSSPCHESMPSHAVDHHVNESQVRDQASTGGDVPMGQPVYASNGGMSFFARSVHADTPVAAAASPRDTPSEVTMEAKPDEHDHARHSFAHDQIVIHAEPNDAHHSDTEENTTEARSDETRHDHPSFAQDHRIIHEDHVEDHRSDTTAADDASPRPHLHDETKSELGENQMVPESELPSLSPAPSAYHEPHDEHVPPTCAWEETTTAQIWIGHKGCKLVEVHVPADSTVGGIAYAEQKITRIAGVYKPTDAVGSLLDATMRVEDKQIIMLRESDNGCHEGCPARSHSVYPPQLQGMRRIDALWNQLGWVAEDEMTWYLKTISDFCHVNTTHTSPPVPTIHTSQFHAS